MEDMAVRFWAKVHKTDDCWVWEGGRKSRRYGGMKFGAKTLLAHRLSWQLHFGPIPDGLFVCHHCDNPSCVRPDHLFLGTVADNNRDMYTKGRGPIEQGEFNANAKLTTVQVSEIRQRYVPGKTSCRRLGREFGVCHQTIHKIVTRREWLHIP